jgi:RNA polymerase sigma-70 factor (ECF subfamily)
MGVRDAGAAAGTADQVAALAARGRAGHPDVAPPAGLDEFLAARLQPAMEARDPEARAADLYLAAACAAGDPAAIARLDADLPAMVRPALARLGLPASDDDEIVQRVRVALFAPAENGRRGVAGYSGRGALRGYVRAVAVRLAMRRLEREELPAPSGDEALAMLPDLADSPALGLLKARCRDELRAAFADALAALSSRERTLLCEHYLDGLTVDDLGRLHGVHRATAARRLEAARRHVLRGVRRHLRVALGLEQRELDSAVALVRSRLDLSLSRLLRRTRPD